MPPAERLTAAGERCHGAHVPPGHGDCFLIAFPREGGGDPYYVLIDCGYKPGSQAFLDHGKSIGDVVEHLHASCGGHLDLAILTHEHQDHLNGIWKSDQAVLREPSRSTRRGLPGRRTRRTTWPTTCASVTRTSSSAFSRRAASWRSPSARTTSRSRASTRSSASS